MKSLTPVAPEKDHAVFGASGSERWLNCPASIKLSENAPPQRESAYATEGTEAHACLEFLLKNRTKDNTLTMAIKAARGLYPLDMMAHCCEAANWILDQVTEHDEFLCETKVDASPFTRDGEFGTVDSAIVREFGRLTVIDFKYGAGIVRNPAGDDGKGDSQLAYYALGISHMYDHNFTDVELVVIQPRAYSEDGETIRSHVLTIEELLEWGKEFKRGVNRAQGPSPALQSGKWCRFCPAAPLCPELKDKALRDAQIAFSDAGGVESVPEPKQIQLAHLSTILAATYRLEDWIEKVRDHAVHVLEHGEEIAGFKLVQKRSPRRWIDFEKTQIGAVKLFGNDALTEPKLLSPAQLEKVFKSNAKLPVWIKSHTTDESSGTTLVSDSDKRPAVVPVKQVFAAPALPPSQIIPSHVTVKRRKAK